MAVPMRSVALAATLSALLLSGCGGGGKPAAATPTPGSPPAGGSAKGGGGDLAQLERLMDRRAEALADGRPRAYAATAAGPQRGRDREAARNARGLGLRDVELAIDSADVRGRAATLRVHALYGVRGIRGRFSTPRRIAARRTAAGWRVRRDTTRRERHPWEVGRLRARRSKHFVVLAPPALELGALLAALEAGYGRMGTVLRRPRLRRRYLVVVAGSAQAARSLTERISGVESLAAISDAEVRESGAARQVSAVVSQRLVVVWPPFSTLDAEGQQRVVTHELTHAALAGATSGRTPAWLIEGVALYVSDDRRVSRAPRPSLRSLSRPNAIARLSGDRQAAAYEYASQTAFSIAERYGLRRLLRLYDAFNDEDLPGGPGIAVTDRAVRRTLGISLRRLERDLRG
jgi:hypothetical protein